MIEIRLNEEMFLELLKGKKIQYAQNGQLKWVVYPPHYGVYLTRSQIEEIKREAMIRGADKVFELIEGVTKDHA